MPLGTATPSYAPVNPIAVVNKGQYLVVFNFAIVGSTNQSSITFVLPFIFQNAQGIGNTIVLTQGKTNTATVDSSASFPATPCVIRRNLVNTVTITQDNTPLFLTYDNTITGGTTQSSSTAAQDAFYNFIHFIKLS